MRAVSVMMLRFDIGGTVSVVRCLNVDVQAYRQGPHRENRGLCRVQAGPNLTPCPSAQGASERCDSAEAAPGVVVSWPPCWGCRVVAASLTGCTQPQLPIVSTAELVRPLRAKLTEPNDRGAVALVTGDESQVAYDGAVAASVFEIGSTTKVLTGLLLAEAVRRGEVGLDDELGSTSTWARRPRHP